MGVQYWSQVCTPLKMTDQSGTIVWAADYTPFGRAQITVEAVQNNLRFPGQYFDGETGLRYNWHRYYDPDTGRFHIPHPQCSEVRYFYRKSVSLQAL